MGFVSCFVMPCFACYTVLCCDLLCVVSVVLHLLHCVVIGFVVL